MNTTKYNNAIREFSGHQGAATIKAILAEIGDDLITTLTGAQIGKVMDAMQRSRAKAKAENCGFDLVDGSAMWIPGIEKDGADGMIVPCDALRSIKREETVIYKPSFADPTRSFSERTTRYTMDFSETF